MLHTPQYEHSTVSHDRVYLYGSAVAGLLIWLTALILVLYQMGVITHPGNENARSAPITAFTQLVSMAEALNPTSSPIKIERNAFQQTAGELDTIVVAIDDHNSLDSERLYTKEAFGEYWAHLKQGGRLILFSNNEILYQRAVLTCWEVLEKNRAGGSDLLVEQAFGYRLPTGAFRYLLVVFKGPKIDRFSEASEWARRQGAVPLFGPGFVPPARYDVRQDPYNILYHPEGVEFARFTLTGAANWFFKAEIDLRNATDDRPFFSVIKRDLPTRFKIQLTLALSALVLLLLLPLGKVRHLDHPFGSQYPPLPVYLGIFSCASASLLFIALAIISSAAGSAVWGYAVFPLLASLLLFAGRLVPLDLRNLIPWGWLASGLAASVAAITAYWLALEWGWASVWLASALGCTILIALVLWICWPLQQPQAGQPYSKLHVAQID